MDQPTVDVFLATLCSCDPPVFVLALFEIVNETFSLIVSTKHSASLFRLLEHFGLFSGKLSAGNPSI